MDPRFVPDRAATERDRLGPPGVLSQLALPSRAVAIADCRRALAQGLGPVLLTGEAGSGKTWTWRCLAAQPNGLGRWLGIDAAPSDDGLALVRRMLRALGRADAATDPDPRSTLAEELAEQAEEGRRWVLVLDEAQNASDAALEEFRLLSNRLGRPDGPAGMVLVGRTGLAFRIRERAWESLDARLAGHVRLGPIDAEEAGSLLRAAAPGREWSRSEIEALHARSLGNPGRLIRLSDRLSSPIEPAAPISPVPSPVWRPSPDRSEDSSPARSSPKAPESLRSPRIEAVPSPSLGEVRPPLRFEDGLIEVGWAEGDEPSPEPTSEPGAIPAEARRSGSSGPALREVSVEEEPAEPTTEAISDPYAAIQARSEWSRAIREVSWAADPGSDAAPECGLDVLGDNAVAGAGGEGGGGGRRPAQVRAESGQEFAPYSRLFSHLGSSSDAE
ncbi:ATP-binding protein [Tautonia sociabilis]|uniref:ORC1/DEAH AAA+ ATPase domain-containing protein n=1 Tax=Tautonia sociabilis TaxID=2080755 RepID=A0A432MK66_9BACT|nr:ATP-binding protein [Tautonia sociabilis]RUL87792.1 hypothetical protein TsocGM_10550 [Tautonia sociabilis]